MAWSLTSSVIVIGNLGWLFQPHGSKCLLFCLVHRCQHVTDSPVSLLLLFSGWNQSLWQMWRVLWKVYSSHDYWSPNSSSVNIQKESVSQRGDILWNLQIAGACFFIPSWDLCLKYLCLFSRMLMRSQSLFNFSRHLK